MGALGEKLSASWSREWKEWYVGPKSFKDDFLAGTAVALAQVPEAVAFALVVGINPLSGLFATFFVGLIASIFGGRPGMISGASGSVAVVQVALKRDYGEQELYFAVILMGIVQMGIGLSGITKFAKLIPWAVNEGFLNGLAIVIGVAQLGSFRDVDDNYVTGSDAGLAFLQCLVGFCVTMLLPYLTTIVPSSLVAIVVTTFIEQVGSLGTKTVGDIGKMGGSFPAAVYPDIDTGEAFGRCLMAAFIYSCVGLVESVMTLQVLDDLTETEGSQSREAFAQGLGNFIAGWFQTMGGSPMIGQSVINVSSGGKRRLSGTWASVLLLVIILAASSVIEMVPTAGLAGVMFSVVYKTFDWSTFDMILFRRIPLSTDAFVIVLVTVTTVVLNLAAAVGIGVAYSAIAFAWNMRTRLEIRTEELTDSWGNKLKVYHVDGRLFFGSAQYFLEQFRDYHRDPVDVVLDLSKCALHDFSAIDAIDHLAEKYATHDRRVHVRNIGPEFERMWDRATKLLRHVNDDTIFSRDHYCIGYEPKPISEKRESTVCETCGQVIQDGHLRFGRVVRNVEFGINTTLWYHFEVDGRSNCVAGHRIVGKNGGKIRGLEGLSRKDRKRATALLAGLRSRLTPEDEVGPHHLSVARPANNESLPGAEPTGEPGASKAHIRFGGETVHGYSRDAPERGTEMVATIPQAAGVPGAAPASTAGPGAVPHADDDEYYSTSMSSDGYSSSGRSDRGVGGIAYGGVVHSHAPGWATHSHMHAPGEGHHGTEPRGHSNNSGPVGTAAPATPGAVVPATLPPQGQGQQQASSPHQPLVGASVPKQQQQQQQQPHQLGLEAYDYDDFHSVLDE